MAEFKLPINITIEMGQIADDQLFVSEIVEREIRNELKRAIKRDPKFKSLIKGLKDKAIKVAMENL